MADAGEAGDGGRVNGPLGLRSKDSLLRTVQELADRYLDPTTRVEERAPSPSRAPSRLGAGRVCTSTNEYIIRGKIGEGGMGVVYRAFDQKLKRDVAFKVLLRPDEDLLERFIREQEMTAALDHPNFVRVLSSGYVCVDDRSFPFYTMPLIRGRTLEKLVLRRGVPDGEGLSLSREYPLRRLIAMVGQLALTLQSAHDKRIIHRDLKPSNVLIGPYGDVYVMDLGLAKFIAPRPQETTYFQIHVMEQLAKTSRDDVTCGAVVGTPYYMAPEQSLSPRAVDERADVFGLGALLYFVLTGERPRFREPVIDLSRLESRRRELLDELRPRVGDEEEVAALLNGPREQVPESLRPALDELEEVKGLLSGADYYKFRRTMRECVIIPPRELLHSRRSAAPPGLLPPASLVDGWIERICMKALSKDPRDRYLSARILWQAIHRYLEPGDTGK